MGSEMTTQHTAKGGKIKVELYHDNFQNFKRYNIPKAQLVIADIPYNIGADAYGSNPMWYNGGDNKNGESKLGRFVPLLGGLFHRRLIVRQLQRLALAGHAILHSLHDVALERLSGGTGGGADSGTGGL